MKRRSSQCFRVRLDLMVPGPEIPRRKHKDHKLLTATRKITLPFAPYPGLILTFPAPKKRLRLRDINLRVRSVEWLVDREEFACVVDEISTSLDIWDTLEVRGSPRTEQHFEEIQRSLEHSGFETTTEMESLAWALHKTASGVDLRAT